MKTIRFPVFLGMCLLVLGLSVSSLWAQTPTTGALTVAVTDPSGAIIPGVTVTVTGASGLTRTAATGADGSYTFPLLTPGVYKVSISATGFATFEIPSVTVNATETHVLKQALKIGTSTQQVTVTTATQAIETETATLGTTVGSSTILALPLIERNYTQIASLSPGVVADVYNASAVGRGFEDFSANGSSQTSNDVLMNGVEVTATTSGQNENPEMFYGSVPAPSPDAIQEFKVQSGSYDAGYGRKSGANTNLITKSGTNDWHGSLFEFFRNTDLNANDFFQKEAGQPRGVLNQNQFGGTVGGPIKKDKLFFFLSYQGTRQINGISSNSTNTAGVPPQLTNDRSVAALGADFCPANYPAGSPGGVYANTFLVAPPSPNPATDEVACDGSNISPVALYLLQAKLASGRYVIPSPQRIVGAGTASAIGLLTSTVPSRFSDDQAIADIDYAISPKNHLSLKSFIDPGHEFRGFVNSTISLASGYSLGGFAGTSAATSSNGDQVYEVQLTSLLSPNLVNQAYGSYYFIKNFIIEDNPLTNAGMGITSGAIPGWFWANVPPIIQVSGLFIQGGSNQDGYKSPVKNFQWGDQISWNHGRQTIRAGYDGYFIHWPITDYKGNIGTLTFQSFADFLLGESGAQNGTAFSNVYSSSLNQTPVGGALLRLNENNADLWVEDDAKVTPRLTLNLGLRWEYDGLFSNTTGNNFDFWPFLADEVPIPPASGTYAGFTEANNFNCNYLPNTCVNGALLPGIYRRNINVPTEFGSPKNDFAPRFGFAWQPFGSSVNLVVRGGAGIFFDSSISGSTLTLLDDGDPPQVAQEGFSATANHNATFQVPYTANASPGFTSFRRTQSSAFSLGSALDPFFKTPTEIQEDLNIQWEFKPSWVMQIGTVDSRGERLVTSTKINIPQLATPSSPVNCGLTPTAVNLASGAQNAEGCVTINTPSNGNLRVPIVGISAGGIGLSGNWGDSEYNSLQAELRKSFRHGLQMQASYTYGRAYTDIAGAIRGGSLNYNNPTDRAAQRGPADYNREQRFIISYIYTFPSSHKTGLVGKALSGWGVAGVTTVQSGYPIELTDPLGAGAYGNIGTGGPEFCPGMGNGNLINPGSVTSKLNDYFNRNAVADTVATRGSASCPYPIVGAFASPGPGLPASPGGTGFGNVRRDPVYGPGQNNWDISFSKQTRVGGLSENGNLEFRAELFNVFNHPQFANPISTVNSALYGVITSDVVAPRIVQFVLRYDF